MEYNLAETKQAISTIYQLGYENKKFLDFPQSKDEIYKFLNNFDWSRPWNAGAQFANISFLAKTQLEDNNEAIDILYDYIETKLDQNSGFYFNGKFLKILINKWCNGTWFRLV